MSSCLETYGMQNEVVQWSAIAAVAAVVAHQELSGSEEHQNHFMEISETKMFVSCTGELESF